MEVNAKEIERYLGYRGVNVIDEHVSSLIEDTLREMKEKVSPKHIHKIFPIEWHPKSKASGTATTEYNGTPNVVCSFAGINVGPGNLVNNLRGCTEIVMMAVTLGPAPDMLVRRYEVRDMLKAYVCQAVGAAMAEAWCDEVNDIIVSEIKERGLYARPRFSPGYGDFPLLVQKDFERILDMPRTIGVTLSDSLLMTPTKSITAVIGISDKDENCIRAGCEVCNMSETCEYSRSRK